MLDTIQVGHLDLSDDALRTFVGILVTHYLTHKEQATPHDSVLVEAAKELLERIKSYERETGKR